MKNNYKRAWTLAEVTVAMIILTVLAGLSVQAIKPKKIKMIPFTYAAIKNLERSAKYIMNEKELTKLSDELVSVPAEKSNTTCVQMAEAMSLIGDYNCQQTITSYAAASKGGVGRPNFQTANLITYSGLEKDFSETFKGAASSFEPCATRAMGMKDIMIDIDGDDGENKVGRDQFPLKLLQSGEVVPGTCSDIGNATPSVCSGQTYDKPTFKKHPKCPSGTTTKYINEKQPFVYNVYRSRPVTEAEVATGRYKSTDRITEPLLMEVSFAQADCAARHNVLTRAQCEGLGHTVHAGCTDGTSFCVVRQAKPLSMNIFALPY